MPACRQTGNIHYYHSRNHKHCLYGDFILLQILMDKLTISLSYKDRSVLPVPAALYGVAG